MQVLPSYGVSPGNNGSASSVARQVVPGPGVSTSNLDSTRTHIVKRGSVVSYHGLRVRVVRVRLGMFWGSTLSMDGRAVPFTDFCGLTRLVQVVA